MAHSTIPVVDYDKIWKPEPFPDPMKHPAVVPNGPSSARWLRRPDESTWHVQTGPEHGARIQRCTGGVALPAAGEGRLELSYGGVFGPACPVCAKLEGCLDPN